MNKINFIHIPKNGGTSIQYICNKENLIYNGHSTDVFNKNIKNQLIVIRNPIDRFISAVNYSIQNYSHEPHVKYLLDNHIDTPEKWIQIWKNEQNKYYPYMMNMIKNKNHKIENKVLEYKWTYSLQHLWINNPKYIIIMDNFTDELSYFINKNKLKGVITKKNSTKKNDSKLSDSSINFLKEFYKKDFLLYEEFKKIPIEKRL